MSVEKYAGASRRIKSTLLFQQADSNGTAGSGKQVKSHFCLAALEWRVQLSIFSMNIVEKNILRSLWFRLRVTVLILSEPRNGNALLILRPALYRFFKIVKNVNILFSLRSSTSTDANTNVGETRVNSTFGDN